LLGIIEKMSRVREIAGGNCKLELEYDGKVCRLDISILKETLDFKWIDEMASKLIEEFKLEKEDIVFSKPIEEDFQVRVGFEVKLNEEEMKSLEKLPRLKIAVPAIES